MELWEKLVAIWIIGYIPVGIIGICILTNNDYNFKTKKEYLIFITKTVYYPIVIICFIFVGLYMLIVEWSKLEDQ